MKILHIVPSLGIGGVENVCIGLLNEQANNLTLNVNVLSQGNELEDVNRINLNNSVNYNFISKKNKKWFIIDMFKIFLFIKRNNYDVVHTHGLSFFYVTIAIILLKIKFIHTIHNEPSKETQGIRKYINRSLFKYNNVKTVILGKKLVNGFIDYYGFKPDMIIPNGVCINRKYINDNSITHREDVFSFISVGRFDKQKNFNRLLKSFKMLLDDGYNISLSIYCSANENDIEFQCFKENIKNIPVFLYLNKVDLSQEYPKYNCFVLASDYEGLPLTILESIGYGLPIVSTNVGCISDVVTKNIGYICEPNSIELYNSMKNIIDNIDEFSKDKIRKVYEKEYSLKIMSDRYVNSYGYE